MVFKSIQSGIAQMWAQKRMVIVFYLINFLFALIMMLPLRSTINSYIGHSLMGAELGGRINMDFVFELLFGEGNFISSAFLLLLVVSGLYWLCNLFLSGGAFEVLVKGEKYSPQLFWGGAARYLGRFIRLFLWSIPVLIVLFCLQFIVTGFEKLIWGDDPYQSVTYWLHWLKLIIRYFGIILYLLVFDYARIITVIQDERKTRKSLLRGIGFAFKNFGRTFCFALILFVLGAIILIIYNPLADLLAAPNVLIVLFLFLFQQVYMFARMMLRVTSFAGQLTLYKKLA